MEKRSEKSQRILGTILDSIADGVFTVDRKWQVTSFNRAAERITGVSREEAIGKKCFEVFHADICGEACALKESLKSGKEIIDRRCEILNSRGDRIPISISTSVLRDERGEASGGVETFRDLSALEELKKAVADRYTFQDIISKNHRIQEIFQVLPDVAESDSTILIQGPSGSGKELFARAIHNLSRRAEGPYLAVNCGALPDSLLESELFGYLQGAFTDAKKDKPGRFARAEGGTLFLDEIGNISPALQVKLLRVLEQKEYEPLGATAPVRADVRIVAAANQDLSGLVAQGRFREDLFYRLNVIRIDLPPLAGRKEDLPLLVEHFIRRFNLRMGKKVDGVSDEAMDVMMSYDFPGNIRELENMIERAMVLCHGPRILPTHLPQEVLNRTMEARLKPGSSRQSQLGSAEAGMIMEALKKSSGHKGKAAQELGIDRSTLWRKMKKHGIK
ncbi:MAG: sigma 54-interacting transcriptional regulator [bacterium]|nr:sigma 54-interacting transcriptional regulator [bacterium]